MRSGRLNTADPTRDQPDPRLIEAISAMHVGRARSVRLIGTSAAWVVLSGDTAWKCRRAQRRGSTQGSSPARRHRDCLTELSLNRHFSPEVYRDLWSLCIDRLGRAHLTPAGAKATEDTPIDTVIRMRRLASDGFLEHRLRSGTAGPGAATQVGQSLLRLHDSRPRSSIDGAGFVQRFSHQIECCVPILGDTEQVANLRAQAQALAPALADRVDRGQVIDSHGDLRPAHLHLSGPQQGRSADPVRLIDALDCSPLLRQVDRWEELSLLSVLAAELGAAWFGPRLVHAYHAAATKSGRPLTRRERPGLDLLAFYTGYHALVRARLAAAHLRDRPGVRAAHWQSLTRRLCCAASAALAGWRATG